MQYNPFTQLITDQNYIKYSIRNQLYAQSFTNNMKEVQWRYKLQVPVEFVKNTTLHTKQFSHWTAALTAANQCQCVRDHLHNVQHD